MKELQAKLAALIGEPEGYRDCGCGDNLCKQHGDRFPKPISELLEIAEGRLLDRMYYLNFQKLIGDGGYEVHCYTGTGTVIGIGQTLKAARQACAIKAMERLKEGT